MENAGKPLEWHFCFRRGCVKFVDRPATLLGVPLIQDTVLNPEACPPAAPAPSLLDFAGEVLVNLQCSGGIEAGVDADCSPDERKAQKFDEAVGNVDNWVSGRPRRSGKVLDPQTRAVLYSRP